MNNSSDRCLLRFPAKHAALQACEANQACGGVTQDNGLLCRGKIHDFELRSGQLETHGALHNRGSRWGASKSWLLFRQALSPGASGCRAENERRRGSIRSGSPPHHNNTGRRRGSTRSGSPPHHNNTGWPRGLTLHEPFAGRKFDREEMADILGAVVGVRGDASRVRLHLDAAVRGEKTFVVVVIGGSATAGGDCFSPAIPANSSAFSAFNRGSSRNSRGELMYNENRCSWSARLVRYLEPLLGGKLLIINAATHATGIEFHLSRAKLLFEGKQEVVSSK